jgi:hypothetical protein
MTPLRWTRLQPFRLPGRAARRLNGTGRGGGRFLRMSDKRLPLYGVKVRPCTLHPRRFRWDILENGNPVQSSPESFATKQEAEAGGFTEIEKLISARGYKK